MGGLFGQVGAPQCLWQAEEQKRFGRLVTAKLGISVGELVFELLSCDPVNTDGHYCLRKAFLLGACLELGRCRDPSGPVLPLP